jgi:Transposase IS116/IS110/IS902 family
VAVGAALASLERRIAIVDKHILARGRGNQTCRHLITIPGYGPILASTMAAIVVAPNAFSSGRHFAASLGLVPGAAYGFPAPANRHAPHDGSGSRDDAGCTLRVRTADPHNTQVGLQTSGML